MKMKNDNETMKYGLNKDMALVDQGDGTWLIKWDDGFKLQFDSYLKAKANLTARVNQEIAMGR